MKDVRVNLVPSLSYLKILTTVILFFNSQIWPLENSMTAEMRGKYDGSVLKASVATHIPSSHIFLKDYSFVISDSNASAVITLACQTFVNLCTDPDYLSISCTYPRRLFPYSVVLHCLPPGDGGVVHIFVSASCRKWKSAHCNFLSQKLQLLLHKHMNVKTFVNQLQWALDGKLLTGIFATICCRWWISSRLRSLRSWSICW